MSFILDALKKSESERQQQGSSEFSQVPISQESTKPPAWIWLLALLLAVNLVVLGGLLLRPDPAPVTTQADPVVDPNFTDQVERAIREAPPVTPAPAARIETDRNENKPSAPDSAATTTTPFSEATPVAESPAPAQGIPDIEQLRAAGELPLGDLRLDIHVYSDKAADRFVFINMVKHREGSTTSDGLIVDTITPDGVVLSYRGKRFLLPRQ